MDAVQEKKEKQKTVLKTIGFSLLMLAMLISPAAATYTFTGNLSDLGQVITDFLSLQDELLQLVIFGVIMSVAGAIGGFITGFFGVIISNLRR